MYDPSMRVLTVLEMLQAKERVSGRDLAERLEVSVRTVQRYVMRLQDLGVPVQSSRGPGGAYFLRPGFRMPPLMLGTDEAFALALGLDALTSLGMGEIATATAGAQAKLERTMPAEIAERVRAVRTALFLEPPRRIVQADFDAVIELALAVNAGRRVELSYVAGDGSATSRTVEPWGLIQHDGRWFMAANCLLRGGPRVFRVDRIRTFHSLEETFTPEPPVDVRAFLYERIALATAPWEIEVWLGASPDVVQARLPRAYSVLSEEGEGTRAVFTATDLEDVALMLLTIDCAIDIRRPEELRDGFRRLAARALGVAGDGRSGASPDRPSPD